MQFSGNGPYRDIYVGNITHFFIFSVYVRMSGFQIPWRFSYFKKKRRVIRLIG